MLYNIRKSTPVQGQAVFKQSKMTRGREEITEDDKATQRLMHHM